MRRYDSWYKLLSASKNLWILIILGWENIFSIIVYLCYRPSLSRFVSWNHSHTPKNAHKGPFCNNIKTNETWIVKLSKLPRLKLWNFWITIPGYIISKISLDRYSEYGQFKPSHLGHDTFFMKINEKQQLWKQQIDHQTSHVTNTNLPLLLGVRAKALESQKDMGSSPLPKNYKQSPTSRKDLLSFSSPYHLSLISTNSIIQNKQNQNNLYKQDHFNAMMTLLNITGHTYRLYN